MHCIAWNTVQIADFLYCTASNAVEIANLMLLYCISCRSLGQYHYSETLKCAVRVQQLYTCSSISALQMQIYCMHPTNCADQMNAASTMNLTVCGTTGRSRPHELHTVKLQ